MARVGKASVVAGVILVAIALSVVAYGPEIVAAQGGPPGNEKWQAIADARTVLVQLIVGSGVIVSALYAARSFNLSRRSQQNERFARAIESIGDANSRTIRVGGVQILFLLARERSEYWELVEKLLCSHVRERLVGRDDADEASKFPDVQAALTALGKRPVLPPGAKSPPLELGHLDLRGFNLCAANLDRADLTSADLRGAQFNDAALTAVTAAGARFDGADLSGTQLIKATLTSATFDQAVMLRTKLEGADIGAAELGNALNLTAGQLRSCRGEPKTRPG